MVHGRYVFVIRLPKNWTPTHLLARTQTHYDHARGTRILSTHLNPSHSTRHLISCVYTDHDRRSCSVYVESHRIGVPRDCNPEASQQTRQGNLGRYSETVSATAPTPRTLHSGIPTLRQHSIYEITADFQPRLWKGHRAYAKVMSVELKVSINSICTTMVENKKRFAREPL